jgi:hypothetical protein
MEYQKTVQNIATVINNVAKERGFQREVSPDVVEHYSISQLCDIATTLNCDLNIEFNVRS